MLNILIEMFVLVLLLILAILLGTMLFTIKSIVFGRYLNRYFVVSRNGKGAYYLHHSPAFGFYYATREKYCLLQEDSKRKFKAKYPDIELHSETSTLQRYYAKLGLIGTPVQQNKVERVIGIGMNYFLILINLASYRKRNSQEWQFIHLMRRVRESTPMQYVILSLYEEVKKDDAGE
ncbi:hypothetical protein [Paenibacillus sp. FSL K6-2859]|uniref:hypothetical protein n=1 Tax=Paenibacillus sp. FSL K6-2859 TaxID=2921482 RepID=UPI0030FC606D